MGNKGFFKKHNKDDSPKDHGKDAQEEKKKHFELLFEQTKGELPYKDMYGTPFLYAKLVEKRYFEEKRGSSGREVL